MRYALLLLSATALAACQRTELDPPTTAVDRPARKDFAPAEHFIIVLGQSNANGPCTADRLIHPDYAYKGISALPLAARTTQAPYGFDATGIDIYYKTRNASDDHSVDNGVWQPYVIGENNAMDGGTLALEVGPEFSMAVKLREHYGQDIHVIKVAFSGTGLHPNTAPGSSPPGTWNPTATHVGNRYIALEYFIRRAVEDFRDKHATSLCVLDGIVWWGGETDAHFNITQQQYYNHQNLLWDYLLPAIDTIFDNAGVPPQVNLVRLNFRRTTREAVVNAAMVQVADVRPHFDYVDTWSWPRCQDLSAAQAAPIPKGNPNSVGARDNQHASHIMELAVGEVAAQNTIAHVP